MDDRTEKQGKSLIEKIKEDFFSRTHEWMLPFSALLGELQKVELIITIGRIFLVPALIGAGLMVLFASPLLSTVDYLRSAKEATQAKKIEAGDIELLDHKTSSRPKKIHDVALNTAAPQPPGNKRRL